MTRAVLFDTETTGLDPQTGHRVIEIAAVELMRDLPSGQQFHTLIHPDRDIPDDAVRIHGITLSRLTGKPRFGEIVDELLAFFDDAPLIAHNAAFDFGFINAELVRLGRRPLAGSRMIDTLEMAKVRFPGLPNSLDALCRRFGVDLSERTSHNALLDCRLLSQVYIELTGGRQRALWSGEVRHGGSPSPIVLEPIRSSGPRVSRSMEVMSTEIAAHAAFIARLKQPIWMLP